MSQRRRDNNGSRSLHCRGYDTLRVGERELRAVFSTFGKVVDVYLPKDYFTKKLRGFAYIQFDNETEAENAREKLDRTDVFGDDHTVNIMWAVGDRKTPIDMQRLDIERDNPNARVQRDRPRGDNGKPDREWHDRSGRWDRHRDRDRDRGGRDRDRDRDLHSRAGQPAHGRYDRDRDSDRDRVRERPRGDRDRDPNRAGFGGAHQSARTHSRSPPRHRSNDDQEMSDPRSAPNRPPQDPRQQRDRPRGSAGRDYDREPDQDRHRPRDRDREYERPYGDRQRDDRGRDRDRDRDRDSDRVRPRDYDNDRPRSDRDRVRSDRDRDPSDRDPDRADEDRDRSDRDPRETGGRPEPSRKRDRSLSPSSRPPYEKRRRRLSQSPETRSPPPDRSRDSQDRPSPMPGKGEPLIAEAAANPEFPKSDHPMTDVPPQQKSDPAPTSPPPPPPPAPTAPNPQHVPVDPREIWSAARPGSATRSGAGDAPPVENGKPVADRENGETQQAPRLRSVAIPKFRSSQLSPVETTPESR